MNFNISYDSFLTQKELNIILRVKQTNLNHV